MPEPAAKACISSVGPSSERDFPVSVTPGSEGARLNRAQKLAPVDHLAVMYGRPARGLPWYSTTLREILLSEAALGYLMRKGEPVIGSDGNPNRICKGLWDRGTHEALKKAINSRRMRSPSLEPAVPAH
ncbi:hypothetical protein ACYBSK_12960 [Streptomyces sp. BYX5S]